MVKSKMAKLRRIASRCIGTGSPGIWTLEKHKFIGEFERRREKTAEPRGASIEGGNRQLNCLLVRPEP
jgi:hypothetical protein